MLKKDLDVDMILAFYQKIIKIVVMCPTLLIWDNLKFTEIVHKFYKNVSEKSFG